MFSHSKGITAHHGAEIGKCEVSYLWEKFCSKNFFFCLELEGKRKTPNQNAEIINVDANESLTQENKENKRDTKMNFNGHVI